MSRIVLDDEKLIKLVRQYKELYDPALPGYVNHQYKMDIWKEIGKEMNVHPSSCKMRWTNLRDNYRRSINKASMKLASGNKRVRPYKFAKLLAFLEKYLGTIKPLNLITYDLQNESGEDEDVKLLHTEDVITSSEREVSEIGEEEVVEKEKDSSSTCTCNKTNQQVTEDEQRATAHVTEEKTDNDRHTDNEWHTDNERHPVDAFLIGLRPMLKKLQEREFYRIQLNIFETVHKTLSAQWETK